MLNWIFIVLALPLSAAMTLVAAALAFLLFSEFFGPLVGASVSLLMFVAYAIGTIKFVAAEGFGKEVFSWWRVGYDTPSSTGAKFALLALMYAIVGCVIYLAVVF